MNFMSWEIVKIGLLNVGIGIFFKQKCVPIL